MSSYLFPALKKRFGYISVLKKGNQYFSITTPLYVFKDALLFTSPCNLSKYLAQNNVVESKSIFPYSFFHSIEELEKYLEFPPYCAFFSVLKNRNVSLEEYESAKAEFSRRKALPESHPESMKSMLDWLIYYNELDTAPLASIIRFEIFSTFLESTRVFMFHCQNLLKHACFVRIAKRSHCAILSSKNSRSCDS